MADLIFTDSHNMVAYLEKSEDNADFAEIVDFLNASSIRFLQLFLNNRIENLTTIFNDEYDTPSHTKKVFANMSRQGKDFSGTVIPLFATMLIQSQAVDGEADETIYEERGDSVERAATTATSLYAEQGSGDTIAQTRVLDLENVKDAQALEIKKLKKKVKQLEKKKKSRTPQLKRRLFKVMIESSVEKSLGDQEDASNQERNEIDQDEGISCIVGVSVSIAKPSTPSTITTPIEDEGLTIAQILMKMKSEKSKAKGVTMQEPSESGTRSAGRAKRKPLTKAQKRNQMSNYLKNIAGYTLQQLRGYFFDEIKTLFETTMRKVNTFVPIESEVDRAVPELAAGSSKRDA
ncbi:hypothetical protein Tco_0720058 [Tanacetum coccineum]